MQEADYKTIINRFANNLECEISQNVSGFHFMYLAGSYQKGNISDEDLIELRGYYKGLKVAREILQRIFNEYYEAIQEKDLTDDGFTAFVRSLYPKQYGETEEKQENDSDEEDLL